MPSEFQHMWDGRLERITTAKHRIEIFKPATRRVHSLLHHAGSETCEFEKTEIDRFLNTNITEPTQIEWASPTLFAPKKEGALQFCIDYRILNAITKRDS